MRSKLPLIGGVVALLAGAGIIAAIWSNGTKRAEPCTSTSLHAPVPAAAKQVLDTYAGRISYQVQRSSSHVYARAWYDALTGRSRQATYSPSGQLAEEFGTIRHGNVIETTMVNYGGRTWMTNRDPSPTFSIRPNAAAQEAQTNRDMVVHGTATVVGRETIGGRSTLHLRQTIRPWAPTLPHGVPTGIRIPAPPAFQVNLWVDPLTYLTVRTHFGPSGDGSVSDEFWLPRTPANIAKTTVVIPAGFKHFNPVQGGGFAFSSGTLQSLDCR